MCYLHSAELARPALIKKSAPPASQSLRDPVMRAGRAKNSGVPVLTQSTEENIFEILFSVFKKCVFFSALCQYRYAAVLSATGPHKRVALTLWSGGSTFL